MKIKCALCGKEFSVGNRLDGTPNGLGIVTKSGKQIDVCADCIEKMATDDALLSRLKEMAE